MNVSNGILQQHKKTMTLIAGGVLKDTIKNNIKPWHLGNEIIGAISILQHTSQDLMREMAAGGAVRG